MTVPLESFSRETLTLPHDDAREHPQLVQEWTTAFPDPNPVERGWIEQAVLALIELRRLARVQATFRTQKVRLALLNWERAEQDCVASWLNRFNDHPPAALVGLLRSAAGCRWAIARWEELALALQEEGTWYGASRQDAIQLQGKSACIEHLYYSLDAFNTWCDSIGSQPNPKQKDINVILDRKNIPKALVEKDVQVWPRDPAECRERMHALVERELSRLRALEATLRVTYEEPERAEAQVMALASVSRDEVQLLRAQRMHEQSYLQAATALLKVRGRTAAAPVRREHPETEQARETLKLFYTQQWRPRGKDRVVAGTSLRDRADRGAGRQAPRSTHHAPRP